MEDDNIFLNGKQKPEQSCGSDQKILFWGLAIRLIIYYFFEE